jgi:hypothetical protein
VNAAIGGVVVVAARLRDRRRQRSAPRATEQAGGFRIRLDRRQRLAAPFACEHKPAALDRERTRFAEIGVAGAIVERTLRRPDASRMSVGVASVRAPRSCEHADHIRADK